MVGDGRDPSFLQKDSNGDPKQGTPRMWKEYKDTAWCVPIIFLLYPSRFSISPFIRDRGSLRVTRVYKKSPALLIFIPRIWGTVWKFPSAGVLHSGIHKVARWLLFLEIPMQYLLWAQLDPMFDMLRPASSLYPHLKTWSMK